MVGADEEGGGGEPGEEEERRGGRVIGGRLHDYRRWVVGLAAMANRDNEGRNPGTNGRNQGRKEPVIGISM